MATATNESVIEQINHQMQSWKMPLPARGDRVIWYQGAQYGDPARGCPAIVTHVDPNFVELVTLGRNQHLQCKKQARHVSDPRLTLGEDWTQYGTWDFLPPSETDRLLLAEVTSALKGNNTRLNMLEQKVARCEDTIIELQKENTEFKKRLAQQAKPVSPPAAEKK